MNVIWTILASVFIFGLIIFVHELGHFLVAKASKIRVNEFALGMGPKIFKFKKGETLYSLRLFPIGGFVSMEGEDEDSEARDSFNNANVGNRIGVVIAGAVMNLILGLIVLTILTATDGDIKTRQIKGFYDNAATASSGLKADDKILAINGRRMYIADDIVYELIRVKDGTADITVQRDGETVELSDVRFDMATNEDGTKSIVIDFYVYPESKSFLSVAKESLLWTVSISRQIFISVVDLVTGNLPMNQLSGPVGIVTVINQATSLGFRSVLIILAFISINLGIFNILPLPALDGGKLVFLVVELFTKKKLDKKYEAIINVVGFGLLMLLMAFVTFNDISRLITG
ncbi:MAG: RIP metalloprotease RseP [Oscillospiraceae bacterium]